MLQVLERIMILENCTDVEEFAAYLKCSKETARDRMHQVNFYFYLLGQPTKGILRQGRKMLIPNDSIDEFLEATSNNFFDTNKWREPITELVKEIQQ